MIPSIVFSSHDLQNIFPIDKPRARVTISRGRSVVIKNEEFDEGVYLFNYDDVNNVFYGILTHTGPLAAVKLKTYTGTKQATPRAKIFRGSIDPETQHLPVGSLEVLKAFLGPDFNIDNLKDFVIEIKATEKVKSTITKGEITSEVIEKQFRSGSAFTREGELIQSNVSNTKEMFLAYVYKESKESKDTILIDIGELWDEGRIDINDLDDILNDRKVNNVSSTQWAESVGKLSPEQKQDLKDKHFIQRRTAAFDEIMKREDLNFESNL